VTEENADRDAADFTLLRIWQARRCSLGALEKKSAKASRLSGAFARGIPAPLTPSAAA
jgi:NADH:ubiquinone oxidoreductase subunit D